MLSISGRGSVKTPGWRRRLGGRTRGEQEQHKRAPPNPLARAWLEGGFWIAFRSQLPRKQLVYPLYIPCIPPVLNTLATGFALAVRSGSRPEPYIENSRTPGEISCALAKGLSPEQVSGRAWCPHGAATVCRCPKGAGFAVPNGALRTARLCLLKILALCTAPQEKGGRKNPAPP